MISSLTAVFFSASACGAPLARPAAPPDPVPSAHFLTLGGNALPTPANVNYCNSYPQQCANPLNSGSHLILELGSWRELVRINSEVNRQIAALNDTGDVWTAPYPGISRGDCEEYVLEKRRRLIEAGFPAGALRMAVVIEPQGQGHAVLVVRTDRGDFVLDNLASNVLGVEQTAHRFLKLSPETYFSTTLAITGTRPGNIAAVRPANGP